VRRQAAAAAPAASAALPAVPGWPRLLAALGVLLGALLALGACTQSTVFYGAQAHELHGRPILLLRPSLIAPTPESVHNQVVNAVQAGMAALPELGPIVTPEALRQRAGYSLEMKGDYDQYANTLSLTGISDPALSADLADGLKVDLLAQAEPIYLPCSKDICDQGDELWLVGEVVDAHTGRIVFRAHLRTPAGSDDPALLAKLAEDLTHEYLEDLAIAFRLRAHRERFENLKRLAAR
jgi:hypothetical protein